MADAPVRWDSSRPYGRVFRKADTKYVAGARRLDEMILFLLGAATIILALDILVLTLRAAL